MIGAGKDSARNICRGVSSEWKSKCADAIKKCKEHADEHGTSFSEEPLTVYGCAKKKLTVTSWAQCRRIVPQFLGKCSSVKQSKRSDAKGMKKEKVITDPKKFDRSCRKNDFEKRTLKLQLSSEQAIPVTSKKDCLAWSKRIKRSLKQQPAKEPKVIDDPKQFEASCRANDFEKQPLKLQISSGNTIPVTSEKSCLTWSKRIKRRLKRKPAKKETVVAQPQQERELEKRPAAVVPELGGGKTLADMMKGLTPPKADDDRWRGPRRDTMAPKSVDIPTQHIEISQPDRMVALAPTMEQGSDVGGPDFGDRADAMVPAGKAIETVVTSALQRYLTPKQVDRLVAIARKQGLKKGFTVAFRVRIERATTSEFKRATVKVEPGAREGKPVFEGPGMTSAIEKKLRAVLTPKSQKISLKKSQAEKIFVLSGGSGNMTMRQKRLHRDVFIPQTISWTMK